MVAAISEALLIDPATLVNRPAAGRDCGSCTLCCKVYEVPAVESPAGTWCRHCQPGRGCGIHETRPQHCRAFFCLWMTQDFLGPDWKPEKSRFVLTMDPTTRWLFAQVDPGAAGAWRKEPFYSQFKRWAAASRQPVIVFVNKLATAVLPDSDVQLGTVAADERLVLKQGAGGRASIEKVKVAA
jgi:hypothetical protein